MEGCANGAKHMCGISEKWFVTALLAGKSWEGAAGETGINTVDRKALNRINDKVSCILSSLFIYFFIVGLCILADELLWLFRHILDSARGSLYRFFLLSFLLSFTRHIQFISSKLSKYSFDFIYFLWHYRNTDTVFISFSPSFW